MIPETDFLILQDPLNDIHYLICEPVNSLPRGIHFTFADLPSISFLYLKSTDQTRMKILRNERGRESIRGGYGDIEIEEISLPSALAFARIASLAIDSQHESKKFNNIISLRRILRNLLKLSKD